MSVLLKCAKTDGHPLIAVMKMKINENFCRMTQINLRKQESCAIAKMTAQSAL